MPKIPTFTSQARPTAEVAGVKSNIKIDPTNTFASRLSDVAGVVQNYYVRERFTTDKTEALELENKAMIDLLNLRSDLEKNANPDLSIRTFKEKSNEILENYSGKATNSRVKNLFKNNFLGEVQKNTLKVNSSNRINLEQNRINGDNAKITRMLTDAAYSGNKVQSQTLLSDISLIYDNQRNENIIDEDNYQLKKNNIPVLIESISVKKQMKNDPIGTFKQLQDSKNYPNIIGEIRDNFFNDARQMSRPIIKEQMDNFLTAAEDGKDIGIDIEAVKTILRPNEYENFLERYDSIKDTISLIKKINLSSIEDNKKIIEEIELKPESYGLDRKKKNIILQAAKRQQDALREDPVYFILNTNDKIKNAFNDYFNEKDENTKREYKKLYIEKIIENQKQLKINKSDIRVMAKSEASSIVEQYINSDANARLSILKNISLDYGDNNDHAMMELSKAGLPMTAEFSSYFNNEQLAKKLLSIDTKEERNNLKQFLQISAGKGQGKSFNDVRNKIATSNTISSFEQVIFTANKIDTGLATEKTNKLKDVLTFYAINEMRANGIDTFDKSIEKAVSLIKDNFIINEKEGYFIPKIFNGKPVDKFQIEKIQQKAIYSKQFFIDKFDLQSFKSNNPNIPEEEINLEFKYQLKNNGKWVNSPDGSGLIFGISLTDGSFAPVTNKDGQNIEINFADKSDKVSGIEINLDQIKKDIKETKMKIETLKGMIPR